MFESPIAHGGKANGGITQLVECCPCKAKVSGSNPLTSKPVIKLKTKKLTIKLNKTKTFGGSLGTQR